MNTIAVATDVRALVVRQLARALADAWRRQQDHKDERPERLNHAAGRDDREDGAREPHESTTT